MYKIDKEMSSGGLLAGVGMLVSSVSLGRRVGGGGKSCAVSSGGQASSSKTADSGG